MQDSENAESVCGQILFGKYQIEKPIKTGGFGKVYRCYHLSMNRPVAVKQVEKSSVTHSVIRNESKILSVLKYPSIPTLYDIQEDEKYYYLVEEFFEGSVLSEYQKQNQLEIQEIAEILSGLCKILTYLHENAQPVLYLDLQPNNIIIKDGRVFLVDFGNAIFLKEQKQEKFLHGTLGYAAPEQYYGEAEKRSDIYALGAILYFLVYGRPPAQQGFNEKKILPLFQEIIDKAMKHCPNDRYENVAEIEEALESLTKRKKQKKENHTLTISFAGSIRRIGTTHISLAFAQYLGQKGYNVLYEERNSSGDAQKLADVCQLKSSFGVYQLQYSKVFPYYNEMIQKPEDVYDIKIFDFGILTEEKKDFYEKSEYRFFVTGVKPWEQISEKEQNSIELVNFSSIQSFRAKKTQKNQLRVPLFLDCLNPDKMAVQFLEQLARIVFEEQEGGRKRRSRCFAGLKQCTTGIGMLKKRKR